MKRLLFLLLIGICIDVTAQVKTSITQFNISGPYRVAKPFALDTVDAKGKKYDDVSLLNNISLTAPITGSFSGDVLPSLEDEKSIGLLSFYVNNRNYIKGKVIVKGSKNIKLFVDGKETTEELNLAPEHHVFSLKFLSEPKASDSIHVVIDANRTVEYTLNSRHPYMFHDLTDGKRVRRISLSPDGRYVALSFQTVERGGESSWDYELRDVKSGQLVMRPVKMPNWLPKTCAWLEEENEGGKRKLYKVDPVSGLRTCFANDIPEGDYTVSPNEDYLIVSVEEEGTKEDKEVFEVLEMDDRQPNWRKRRYLVKLDLNTSVLQRITFGSRNTYLEDISQDGEKLLVSSFYSRLSKRPTEVQDVFVIDATTLQVDSLFICEGFLGSGRFSPDGKQILMSGTPEAFNRIGCQLPSEIIPSMTENELFLYDIVSKKVKPLTKDFDPSIDHFEWSWADGQIYFSAEDLDYVNMFQMNPQSGKITKLPIKGDNVYRYDLPNLSNVLAYFSYKTMEPASAYVLNLKTGKHLRLFDGHEALGDAEVGTCEDWNFTNSRGDTVYGRLYLPQDFDASKQYPMIVYYYGGCSPVSRYFESPYAPQYWNSLGYVAYILQPSGATGFGQEWASRHVNTAGRGPAEDIIEGTKKICETHPFINSKKIGCMGASYGGFMTQYLQTQTDIFAAAVSHAGISNHTSYWGEGYWGYNYSEVSMANSYPWSHRQLFVDQSPLFNADKIHTPLLLLHGNADTNVPLIESLQMFTALKLLGREVALVEVEGENHHILDYSKKEKWVSTQMAWFAKWLKDDSTWWDALYPKKHL